MHGRLDYYVARNDLAHDVRDGAVALDPHALAGHIEACAAVPSDVAAEWAIRFLQDLQRHRDPAQVARRQRRAAAADSRTLHALTDEAASLACRASRWTGTWNRAKGDAVNVLGEGGPIPSAQDLAARVVREALVRRRAA